MIESVDGHKPKKKNKKRSSICQCHFIGSWIDESAVSEKSRFLRESVTARIRKSLSSLSLTEDLLAKSSYWTIKVANTDHMHIPGRLLSIVLKTVVETSITTQTTWPTTDKRPCLANMISSHIHKHI